MKLYFKLDHIATVRSAGGGKEPEPVVAAALAELSGIGGITIHLHADRGNVKLRDVQVLKETLSVPLNLELAPIAKNRQHAFDLRPDLVTVVAEPKDVHADRWPVSLEEREHVGAFVKSVGEADLRVGVLVRPTVEAIRFVHKSGAPVLMLDTTAYAMAKSQSENAAAFELLSDCARLGRKLGLSVHLGGGLDMHNIERLASLPIEAMHVGYAIVARSIFVGVGQATRQMIELIEKAAPA